MDKLMFQEIKQSHILAPYYCNTMDELAKDLNNALDESSDFRIHDGKVKRSKTWKCRPKSKCGLIFGSNVLKYSAKSEDSESSLDNWLRQEIDISRKGSHHYTDSDDILCKVSQHSNHLSSWRHCATNLGESDSVNENLHPFREPRRKRKFKRMSVDPPVTENEFSSLSSIPFCTKKNKRLRNLKSHTISKLSLKSPKPSKLTVSQLSAEMENICKDFGNASAATGKRKRCSHEKSIECNGYECKDFLFHKNDLSRSSHHLKTDITSKAHDINCSGLSSSESDCGVLTNDESREADDEQSDFFQESGPTYGIPNFSPWWQDEDLIPDEKTIFDPDFQDILCKSFQHMSETAKKMYIMQLDNYKAGRQIRSGRRRLGRGLTPKLSQKMICPDELFMPSANEFDCFSLSVDTCLTKIAPNEKKKRKGMPPLSGFGEFIPCIPESNIGFQVLKNMGWKPGTGLGRIGEGIISPVKASVSHGKQGLGFSKRNSENVHSAPPPPPSSPQPFITQNENST